MKTLREHINKMIGHAKEGATSTDQECRWFCKGQKSALEGLLSCMEKTGTEADWNREFQESQQPT